MNRYAIINNKNMREIVLLRGSGCNWKKCRFCDYHQDFDSNALQNTKFNQEVLVNVTGLYQQLEIINSGSFSDLPSQTIDDIISLCQQKNISTLYFECHWIDRKHIAPLREKLTKSHINLIIKSGIETFDGLMRQSYLNKGIPAEISPSMLADHFDECCLLFGLPGQHLEQMISDISIGLNHFQRICINLFCNNSSTIKRDEQVIRIFTDRIYPLVKDHPNIDILIENTDFGIG